MPSKDEVKTPSATSVLGKTMLTASVILAAFAILGAGLVGLTYETTKEQIAANEREFLLRSLHELVPTDRLDNDMYSDAVAIDSREWLGTKEPVMVYRARKAGTPVAAVIATQAPDGYSGTIKLLVAINYNGELAGVRVVSHKETPGLGDAIEISRSNWIKQFDGRSLNNPGKEGWKVRKDGGVFDQLTGATITPRAIVKATYKALVFYRADRDILFSKPSIKGENQDG